MYLPIRGTHSLPASLQYRLDLELPASARSTCLFPSSSVRVHRTLTLFFSRSNQKNTRLPKTSDFITPRKLPGLVRISVCSLHLPASSAGRSRNPQHLRLVVPPQNLVWSPTSSEFCLVLSDPNPRNIVWSPLPRQPLYGRSLRDTRSRRRHFLPDIQSGLLPIRSDSDTPLTCSASPETPLVPLFNSLVKCAPVSHSQKLEHSPPSRTLATLVQYVLVCPTPLSKGSNLTTSWTISVLHSKKP